MSLKTPTRSPALWHLLLVPSGFSSFCTRLSEDGAAVLIPSLNKYLLSGSYEYQALL